MKRFHVHVDVNNLSENIHLYCTTSISMGSKYQ